MDCEFPMSFNYCTYRAHGDFQLIDFLGSPFQSIMGATENPYVESRVFASISILPNMQGLVAHLFSFSKLEGATGREDERMTRINHYTHRSPDMRMSVFRLYRLDESGRGHEAHAAGRLHGGKYAPVGNGNFKHL